MDKAQLLAQLDEGHAQMDEALTRISRERMVTPAADGGWSAKDIVAHLTWSEREMVGVLQQRALVGSDLWNLSQDERNAAVYAENRDRALDETLGEAQSVFAELRAEIERLSDEDLNNPALIAEMPDGLTPWRLLAGITSHYPAHVPALQALADQQG